MLLQSANQRRRRADDIGACLITARWLTHAALAAAAPRLVVAIACAAEADSRKGASACAAAQFAELAVLLLLDLDHADLQELGLGSGLQRKRVLAAIKQLSPAAGGGGPTPESTSVLREPSTAPTSTPPRTAR